ncbi:MAG: response regulator [Deltaproteobacteria bacterium]|nr:response regulator [Nannocystaceae bacterium]
MNAIRVLMIEDSERDCELLVLALRRGGYELQFERVETLAAIESALDRGRWDLVISDFSLPQLDAPRALAAIQARGLDVPFIIVSGTVDEETAVDSMRAGAHDFMSKDRLARLIPVVARELAEAAGRAERRHMHEQLLVSDRLASLGTVAAGVAHEINNPLAAVMANIELAIEVITARLGGASEPQAVGATGSGATDQAEPIAWLRADMAELLEVMRDVREGAVRVRDVARDLKVFSRGDDLRRTTVDVRDVLESSLRLAHTEIRHRAQLVRDYGEVPVVVANPSRLGQVFLNLAVNAAQALPDGDAQHQRIHIVTRFEPPERVIVEFRDSGHGIPASILPRIFDPFFTTKPVGVGSGLGLGICYRIIRELGGDIEVESREGEGATFRVSLPVAREVEVLASPPGPSAARSVRRVRILVVDDDVLVASALRRMLAEHDITAISDARIARDMISAGTTFDLVLCDLMMPNLTGMALYRELERAAPAMAERMVFMTGGAFSDEARGFLEDVQPRTLDKPFDLATLRELVDALVS